MLGTAAIAGLLAVALGAFGAHGLKNILEQNASVEIWKTASLYHLVHSVVLLLLALVLPKAKGAFYAFGAGIFIFSGTLYLLAVTQIKWLGAVTPVGGLALMGGWLLLAFKPRG